MQHSILNPVDRLIFRIESKLSKFNALLDMWSKDEVDDETMVNAAIAHFENENKDLKSYHIPRPLIQEGMTWHCPRCKNSVQTEHLKKYCVECGQRIFKEKRREKT